MFGTFLVSSFLLFNSKFSDLKAASLNDNLNKVLSNAEYNVVYQKAEIEKKKIYLSVCNYINKLISDNNIKTVKAINISSLDSSEYWEVSDVVNEKIRELDQVLFELDQKNEIANSLSFIVEAAKQETTDYLAQICEYVKANSEDKKFEGRCFMPENCKDKNVYKRVTECISNTSKIKCNDLFSTNGMVNGKLTMILNPYHEYRGEEISYTADQFCKDNLELRTDHLLKAVMDIYDLNEDSAKTYANSLFVKSCGRQFYEYDLHKYCGKEGE